MFFLPKVFNNTKRLWIILSIKINKLINKIAMPNSSCDLSATFNLRLNVASLLQEPFPRHMVAT